MDSLTAPVSSLRGEASPSGVTHWARAAAALDRSSASSLNAKSTHIGDDADV